MLLSTDTEGNLSEIFRDWVVPNTTEKRLDRAHPGIPAGAIGRTGNGHILVHCLLHHTTTTRHREPLEMKCLGGLAGILKQ